MRMFRRRTGNNVEGAATTTDDRGGYQTDDGQTYARDDGSAPVTDDRQTYDAPATPGRDDRQTRAARTTPERDDRSAYATGPGSAATDDGRRWHHGPARALMTLLGVGVAGLLAWLTTNISDTSTGGYWAAYGILAGAGLVMALSQLLGGWTKWGRPSFSPTVFLLAFVPTLIAVGWIFVFHQPHSTLGRGHVMSWSNDIGINGFVKDMGGDLLTMLGFGLGLVFGFCFDTTGARRPAAPGREPVMRPTARSSDADQPIAREREQQRPAVRS